MQYQGLAPFDDFFLIHRLYII